MAQEPVIPQEAGLAAVRLEDGRQVIVQGVPVTLAPGDEITCTVGTILQTAVISIAPPLLLYVDPAVPRGRFETLVRSATQPRKIASQPGKDESNRAVSELPDGEQDHPSPVSRQETVPEPIALIRWETGGPDDAATSAMLALAYQELDRLDDAGEYPVRPDRPRR
jgi:hypothetical protein